jgi:cytochrome c oxidase assembly protein subunit 15
MGRADVGHDAGGLRRLGAAFAALVAPGFCLIVLGALVRAHEAGLACPDWPLCFGQFIPAMDLKVGFEWSHRLLAGGVSLAFAALAFLTLRRPDAPSSARRLILVAGALLVVQILLGALTVWQLLAAWTVTSHLVTGNAFVLTLLLIALALRATAGDPSPVSSPRTRAWLTTACALLLVQVVLGGLVSSRFAGLACPEWPACNGGLWFPTWRGTVGLHLLHRWNAIALLAAVFACAWIARADPRVRRATAIAAGIVIAQLLVGIANVCEVALPLFLLTSLGCASLRAPPGGALAADGGGASDAPRMAGEPREKRSRVLATTPLRTTARRPGNAVHQSLEPSGPYDSRASVRAQRATRRGPKRPDQVSRTRRTAFPATRSGNPAGVVA